MHINSVNGYYILCFRNVKGCFTFSAYKAKKKRQGRKPDLKTGHLLPLVTRQAGDLGFCSLAVKSILLLYTE